MLELVNAGGHIFREVPDEKAAEKYLEQGYRVVGGEQEQVPEFVIANEGD